MKGTFKAVIIDDSTDCLFLLKEMIEYSTPIKVVATASDGCEGEVLIMKHRPNIVFLDIAMPGMNGLELLRKVHDKISWPMYVIVVSAHNSYAIEAMREYVFDFLLKPFDQSNLLSVIERLFIFIAKEKEEKEQRKIDTNTSQKH